MNLVLAYEIVLFQELRLVTTPNSDTDLMLHSAPTLYFELIKLKDTTVFDTEEKQLCLGKSKAQLPGRLTELCFTPGQSYFSSVSKTVAERCDFSELN